MIYLQNCLKIYDGASYNEASSGKTCMILYYTKRAGVWISFHEIIKSFYVSHLFYKIKQVAETKKKQTNKQYAAILIFLRKKSLKFYIITNKTGFVISIWFCMLHYP